MEFAAAALIILSVGLMVSSVERKLGRMERRLKRMERRLDAVVEHLGIATEERDLQQVDMLLRQGKKPQAVKLYQEITGAGPFEAAEAVKGRAAAPAPGHGA
jgi:ribosomal protein L7/L12